MEASVFLPLHPPSVANCGKVTTSPTPFYCVLGDVSESGVFNGVIALILT